MSHRDVPVPDRIRQSCRLDPRGFPIPYVTYLHPVTGEAVFRVVDRDRMLFCIRRRRCGICGQRLGKSFCFIGGPTSVKTRVFSDPPNHYTCARYAMRACPFLASPRGTHKGVPVGSDLAGVAVAHPMAGDRPERVAIYTAADYEEVQVNSGPDTPAVGACLAAPALDIEWFQ